MTSLCPCSKEISEYGAHNQRGYVTLEVRPKAIEGGWELILIEDLIEVAEKSGSAPVYALLKRTDEVEKYKARLSYLARRIARLAGLPAEDQAAVFEEFRQVGRNYTNKQEGTGLGLAMIHGAVSQNGGRVEVRSELGRGTTVVCTFPLKRAPTGEHAQRTAA